MVSKKAKGRTTEKIPNKSSEEETKNGGVLSSSAGYEQFREQRIKANLERMQKLGIMDLSKKLKSEFKPPPKPKNPSQQKPPLPPPSRRSSRLKTMTPVSYLEKRVPKEEKVVKKVKVHIPEGSKPEVYTEEHEKALGDSKTTWILYVDGYDNEGQRIYDQFEGKSCHQCRQKTLGRHTDCSKCKLLQGKLCGDCLYTRYGENVIEANENPDWTCPACRGICNCSRCRRINGWAPTGSIYKKVNSTNLHHFTWVQSLGFKSVAHYLIKTRGPLANREEEEAELSDGNSVAKVRTAREEGKEGESLNDNNGGGGSTGYEKIRDETIKANMEKMEKLGVVDLSRKLKSQIHPLKSKIPSPKNPTLPPSAPPRRSSRLTGSELAVKKRDEKAGKQAAKKTEAVTDPDKPKRPASAFFVFMEDFRKQHKEEHPDNKSVSVVGKAGGDKWKLMSDAEKASFVAKAEKRKVEYEKNMQAYKNKQAEGNDATDEEEQKTLGCHTDCSKCKLLQGKLCGDCLYTRYNAFDSSLWHVISLRPQVLTQTVEEEEAELSGGNSALGSDEEDGDGGGEVEEVTCLKSCLEMPHRS
ncbi:hypothetical protein LguiB_022188 [Lonicera macranthoides]